jgi:hypothetical protein
VLCPISIIKCEFCYILVTDDDMTTVVTLFQDFPRLFIIDHNFLMLMLIFLHTYVYVCRRVIMDLMMMLEEMTPILLVEVVAVSHGNLEVVRNTLHK